MKAISKSRLPVLLLVLALFAGACSGSDDASKSDSTQKSSSTTTAPAEKAPYAKAGPYKVGFTERKLADGRRVVVWYPSTEEAVKDHEPEKIDLAGFLNPELQAKIPAENRPEYSADAFRDADVRPEKGGYPVVLFSHGYAGFPEQSVSLTVHMASWGYVVAAPEHVERSLPGMLGTTAQGVPKSTDPEVLGATLDMVQKESASSGALLSGAVDPDHAAVTGHSAGAGATFRMAATDSRIDGWIAYSLGYGSSDDAERKLPDPPKTPGMVQLGTNDGVIPASSTEAAFQAMNSPKYMVKYEGAGHLVFSDICLMGADKGGIVNIAKALKLPIPPDLLKLGTDGCGDAYPAVDAAFPAMNQTTIAFLRMVFGQDDKPVGLSTEAVADLGADVTVTEG